MHEGMSHFGFGRHTGIDLPGEPSGLMPSREWKQRVRGQPWYPGETVITGIGQGYMLVTPVQLASATAMAAAAPAAPAMPAPDTAGEIPDSGPVVHLTQREEEILTLVAKGQSSKQIARALGISPKTVEFHRSNLLKKHRVKSAVELVHKIAQTP